MANNRLVLDTPSEGVLTRDRGRYFYKCPKCKLKNRPYLHYRQLTFNVETDVMEVRCAVCDFEEWITVSDL
jgi:hypothetical protein